MQSFEGECSAVAQRHAEWLRKGLRWKPGFIGRKHLKRGFGCVLKNAHDLLRAGIDGVRGEAEFPARYDWRGL